MPSEKTAEVAEIVVVSTNEQGAETLPRLQLRDSDNPAIQRALRRLRESQDQMTHMAHHTKHTSHSTHSKGAW
jgi:hypothetical protein